MRTASFLVATTLLTGGTLPSYAEGQVFRIAIQSDSTLHVLAPHLEVSSIAQRLAYNLYDTLLTVDYDHGWSLLPGLAESWKQIDATTYEFMLRKDVKFHNGDMMKASDVAFSLSPQRLLSESWPGAGAMKQFWSGLQSVEAVDDFTVRFVTKAPDVMFLYRVAVNGSEIVSEAAYRAADNQQDWARRPVGTGPFRVADYRPDEKISYTAFKDYWGGAPLIDGIDWHIVPDADARIIGLAAGDYDMIADLPPDQIARVDEIAGAHVEGGPIGNMHLLIFDTQNPVLADIRMRRALSMAVDRQLFVDSFWGGLTSIPNGYQFEAFGPLYDAVRQPPRFDVEEAKRLVRTAGYDGQTIPFNITNNYYATEVARAEVMVDMWRQIGVNVEIKIHEDFSNLNGGLRNGATTIYYPDPVGSICRTWGEGSFWDQQGVMSAIPERSDMFENCKKLAAASREDERKELFAHILDFFETHLPNEPLHSNAMLYGLKDKFTWSAKPSPIMDFRAGSLTLTPQQ